MTEWAPAAVSLALRSAVQILAYPMTNMSMLPSETFGPNRDVMSSGGTADRSHVPCDDVHPFKGQGKCSIMYSSIYRVWGERGHNLL